MSSRLQISLAQIDVVLGDLEANFEQIVAGTAAAAGQGSDLVLFPELWSSGYDLENWQKHASRPGRGLFERVADLALEQRIAIGGSFLEARGGRAYNTFALFGPDGAQLGLYRKIHLFRLMDEHLWLAPGDRLELAAPPWGATGLAICYDLRFPEMFRAYALAGAGLVLLVAEWPAVRIQHWRNLLQARAIENQLFIAAVNRVGTSKETRFGGESMIISPSGKILAAASDAEDLVCAQIDLAQVAEMRAHIPVFEDRRPDIYGLGHADDL